MVLLFKLLPFIVILFVSTILILVCYLVTSRLGYPKAAKVLSIVIGVICAIFTLKLVFDDELFSKSDASLILNTMGISLSDNFEITNNKSFVGPDIFHTVTLQISTKDKSDIIEKIVSSENYKSHNDISRIEQSKNGEPVEVRIKNYDTDTSFVTEYEWMYRSLERTIRTIIIDKRHNRLILEEWF